MYCGGKGATPFRYSKTVQNNGRPMNLQQLLSDFKYDDLQWFLPVLAGLVIILGGLIIGIFRGMSAGVIVALFFGGLMSMSPVLLNALQRSAQFGPVDVASANVARSAAALSELNNDVIVDLSRVVASMRNTLDGISPLLENEDGEPAVSPAFLARFNQGLSDTEERLDAAISSLSRSTSLRQDLEDDVQTLDIEMRRGATGR